MLSISDCLITPSIFDISSLTKAITSLYILLPSSISSSFLIEASWPSSSSWTSIIDSKALGASEANWRAGVPSSAPAICLVIDSVLISPLSPSLSIKLFALRFNLLLKNLSKLWSSGLYSFFTNNIASFNKSRL